MNATATKTTTATESSRKGRCCGGRGAMVLVTFGLLGSLALNAAIVVHYRVPPRLWAKKEPKPALPEITLRPATFEKPVAKLAFGNGNVPEWQAAGRAKLAELLGVSLSKGTPKVRQVRSERVGAVTRETLVFEQEDGVEVPAFLLASKSQEKRPAILVIPGHSYGIVATAGIVDDYQHSNAL